MGLLDFVKLVLGSEEKLVKPSMAEITIISSEPATQTSESQSAQAQG